MKSVDRIIYINRLYLNKEIINILLFISYVMKNNPGVLPGCLMSWTMLNTFADKGNYR